jgi:hypothetical protein
MVRARSGAARFRRRTGQVKDRGCSIAGMDRRSFLAHAVLGTAALTLPSLVPARVAAQPAPGARDRLLLDVARQQIDRAGQVLWKRDKAAVIDFGLHSSQARFHIVDLESATVRSLLVAHGAGSDPEHDGWLNAYSNLNDSWATSRGAYVSWEWYEGRYGTSMRLSGLDADNSNAFDRAIVMHAASYSTPDHLARWGRLGRSNGCFAIGPEEFSTALYLLGGGRLLYADTLGIGADGAATPPPAQASVDFEGAIARRRMQGLRGDTSYVPGGPAPVDPPGAVIQPLP